MESLIERVESIETPRSEVEILPGFPEKISGEIIFCDADILTLMILTRGNILTKTTFPRRIRHASVWRTMAPSLTVLLVLMTSSSPVSSSAADRRESRLRWAILAKQIPLVLAGSLGNIFSRNSFNNALMGLEVPRLA